VGDLSIFYRDMIKMVSVNENHDVEGKNGSLTAYAVALPRKVTKMSFYDSIPRIGGIRAKSPEKAVKEIVKCNSKKPDSALSMLENMFGGIGRYALEIPEAPKKDSDTGRELNAEERFNCQRRRLACMLEEHYDMVGKTLQGDYPDEPDVIESYRAMDEAEAILNDCGIRGI